MQTTPLVDSEEQRSSTLSWDASISMLGNATLIGQLALVLGLGALSVFCLMTVFQAIDGTLTFEQLVKYASIALGIFAGLMLLGVGVMLLFYGNRYHYRYTVDEHGVTAVTIGRTRKSNRVINLLLIASGRPAAMGAGLLANAGQSQTVHWNEIDRLSANPQKREIILLKGRRAVMLIQCTAETYEQVFFRLNHQVKNRETSSSGAPSR